MKLSIALFTTFIALHLFIVSLINFFPLENGNYPYRERIGEYYPFILTPLASFDGAHYILIAKEGYSEFQQAFFPLYPLLLNIFSVFTKSNMLISGIVVSVITFFLGIFFYLILAKEIVGRNYKFATLFLLSFPTAFFYVTLYPEGLFLFTSAAALFFLFKKNYLLASIFAILSSLTKIQGLFLLIPFIIQIFEINSFNVKLLIVNLKKNLRKTFFALSPLYGIGAYSTYLYAKHGDPFYYYHVQEAFGAERTSAQIILIPQVIYRYIMIILTAQQNFQYFVAILELTIFLVVFLVLLFDLYKIIKKHQIDFKYLSVNLYSLAILTLPTLTGTFSSVPRYALIAFGFFFALSKIENRSYKWAIITIMGTFHLILFLFYLKGYFVG